MKGALDIRVGFLWLSMLGGSKMNLGNSFLKSHHGYNKETQYNKD